MGGPFQRAPCGIAVTHHDAAVIAEEGLRVDLAAARLIIQKNDGLVTALAAAISPHIRCAGGLFVLLLEDLNRRLVAMDERLRSEPQLQGLIDAGEMFLARADHPATQSAAADRNTGAFEGLRQAVERRAIDIFMNQRERQR